MNNVTTKKRICEKCASEYHPRVIDKSTVVFVSLLLVKRKRCKAIIRTVKNVLNICANIITVK